MAGAEASQQNVLGSSPDGDEKAKSYLIEQMADNVEEAVLQMELVRKKKSIHLVLL